MMPNHMKFLLNISNDMDCLNAKKKFRLGDKGHQNLELNLQSLLELSEEQKQQFCKQEKKLLVEKQFYDQY